MTYNNKRFNPERRFFIAKTYDTKFSIVAQFAMAALRYSICAFFFRSDQFNVFFKTVATMLVLYVYMYK